MFEHVGNRNYAEFFARIRELLSDDGVALIHSIGYADTPGPINPFIRKYIFPGADLPSLSEVFTAVEPTGFFVTDVPPEQSYDYNRPECDRVAILKVVVPEAALPRMVRQLSDSPQEMPRPELAMVVN